jgi:4-hydroxy-tetrahydrodipicolinate synthase
MNSPLSGVFAALATPIDDLGRIDLVTFERIVDFTLDRGVDGIVLGGGTAEYPHFSIDDRARLSALAVRRANGRGVVITCVGTSSIHSTLQLARCAQDSGSDLLLVPMPFFFRYEQQDLAAFVDAVCRAVTTRCLLYNLPSFTNPLDISTALQLIDETPNVVGMKDSSGDSERLKPLADARQSRSFSLFVGDDSLLLEALSAGWDGVVSGIACFVPELIAAVYRSYRKNDEKRARICQDTVDRVIEYLVRLPIPWGVRVGLETRGIPNGPMHVPPSPQRRVQMDEMAGWLIRWAAQNNLELGGVWPTG